MSAAGGRRIVGRDREQELIAAAIAGARDETTILTIDGDAGSGKTTLLDASMLVALDAGATLLRCAPTEAEVALPYAALSDLLAPITDLDGLDDPLRHAIERALLRSTSAPVAAPVAAAVDVAPLDARTVGQALARLLELVSTSAIAVLVVDDVQWLDPASAAALAFAARRLPPAGIAVLAGHRRGTGGPTLPGDVLELPALSDASIESIVGERTHLAARPVPLRRRREIVEAALGNPLFAIELARAETDAHRRSGRVPSTLTSLLSARFGHLEPSILDTLAMLALLGRPDLPTVRRLGIGDQVERAERDGIIDTSTGRVAFVHPLFAAAVVDRLPAMSRRTIHRRLAGVVEDPADAARHAALAAEAPDAALAAALMVHAEVSAARAALDHASDLAVLAVGSAPLDDPSRPTYCVRAAELLFRSGDAARGARLLDEMGPRDERTPSLRVAELLVRSRIAFETGEGRADELAAQALEHCTTDEARVEAMTVLARATYDDFALAADRAGRALELAERTPVSPSLLASALIARADAQMIAGHGLDRSLYLRAMAIEQDLNAFASDSAYGSLAVMLKTSDELDEAREMLLTILRSDADDGALPYVLSHLPQLELWAGNWDTAEEYAQRHLDAALRTGQHDQVVQARFNQAYLDVHRGDVAAARSVADEMERVGAEGGSLWTERNGVGLNGLIALVRGDAPAAVAALERWTRLSERMAVREPGYCRFEAEYVEALVATGDLARADVHVRVMVETAERLDRPGRRATAWRVGALAAAAAGDRERSLRLATDAVALHRTTPLVFERARSLLTLGQVHRRFKEKAAARDVLQAALGEFERLGADGFAARARLDLARLGLRPPSSASLTETERRVARAAATGRTVRQVGDELFISPKTVEANLTRVYRKLGISGRAELATWLAAGEPDPHR